MHSGSSENCDNTSSTYVTGTEKLTNVNVLFGLISLSVFNALIQKTQRLTQCHGLYKHWPNLLQLETTILNWDGFLCVIMLSLSTVSSSWEKA